MKAFSYIISTIGLATVSLLAIEPPLDDAPPPIEVAPPAAEAPPADVPVREKAAYLGVVSGGTPEMLAEHLGLRADEGIVVRALLPDGPAAQAGLAMHDVIIRIDGQPVGSSEDLTREVAARQPGDQVRLEVIHKGKPADVNVTLGIRPEQLAVPQLKPLDDLNLDGIPRELADRVRRMIEGNVGDLRLDFEQGMEHAAPQFEDAMREMKLRMEKAMQGLQVPDVRQQGGIQTHQRATLRLMDEQGSIELKSNEGNKEITVRDKDQNVVWSGPWDTEQDKAAAPEGIRQRVEKLSFDENGNGLRLQFQGAIPEP